MERKNRWKFYNHALIPVCPENDRFEEKLSYSKILKEWRRFTGEKKRPLFCLYPTNFDCGYETEWWYNIKDDVYDIETLNSKKRYEIKKGLKNFSVELIAPQNFVDEIFQVYERSFSAYPEKYRPVANFEQVKKQVCNKDWKWFGAFSNETGELCGFIISENTSNLENKTVVNLISQKTIPEYERLNVNFALLDCFLNYFNSELKEKRVIITNGQRNINHETQFNEFLAKYFGFRRAYSKLNIKFHPMVSIIAKILYVCILPLLKSLEFRTENPILYKITVILKYIKIEKECKRQCKKNKS